METLIADPLCLINEVAASAGAVEYELRLGLVWIAMVQLKMVASDVGYGVLDDYTDPLRMYEPVDATISLDTGTEGLLQQARVIATDCVNQGGIQDLDALKTTLGLSSA